VATEMVRFFDPATRTLSAIPRAELTPGAVAVHVEGAGEVWVDAEVHSALMRERLQDFAAALRRLSDELAQLLPALEVLNAALDKDRLGG
jgi:hypothetical protein